MLNKKNVSRLAQPDKLVKLITDWCKNKQTKETKIETLETNSHIYKNLIYG